MKSSDLDISQHSDASLAEAALAREERERERKTLARKEDQAVKGLRFLVVFVLVLAACTVALFISNYVQTDQTNDFRAAFDASATKVISAFQATMARKVESIDAFATSITSYALATNTSFPFITIPDYEIRAANTRVLADVSDLNFQPLVKDEDRRKWEEYANENRDLVWDAAVASEISQRAEQDARLGVPAKDNAGKDGTRKLQAFAPQAQIYEILANGTRAPRPEGSGPFAPRTYRKAKKTELHTDCY